MTVGPIWNRLWTKVHDHLGRCKKPLVNRLARFPYNVWFRRYRPLKLPWSCKKCQIFRDWVKTPVLLLAVSGPKFMKFADSVWDHSWFPALFPDCQYVFLAGDNSRQICHRVAKSKIGPQYLGPKFLRGGRPNKFYRTLLPWFTPYCVAKFGIVLWSEVAVKLWKRRIFKGYVKMTIQFEMVSGPKFMSFGNDIGDPFQTPTHLSDCLYHVLRIHISFCHSTPIWQTDRQNCDTNTVRCITCSRTVKTGGGGYGTT